MSDKLETMFELRKKFMTALNESETLTLDLQKKEDQRFLRDMALRGVEEVFEALQHLKNWKPHRKTEVPDFDNDKFLEEWIDAFNYFFSVLILAGFTEQDVYKMFVLKDKIIHERLKTDY